MNDHIFTCHPKCIRTRTISLLFADDLLVFCKANDISLLAVKDQLKKFSIASSLSANFEKSDIYLRALRFRCKSR